jgi:hypothetical protein
MPDVSSVTSKGAPSEEPLHRESVHSSDLPDVATEAPGVMDVPEPSTFAVAKGSTANAGGDTRERASTSSVWFRLLSCFLDEVRSEVNKPTPDTETTALEIGRGTQPSAACQGTVAGASASVQHPQEARLGAEELVATDDESERAMEVSSASEELPFRSLYRRARVQWARRRLEKQVRKLIEFTSNQISHLQHVRSGQKLDAEFAMLARIYTNSCCDEEFERFERQEFCVLAKHMPLFLNYLLHSRPLDTTMSSLPGRNSWREVASSTRERIRRHQSIRLLIETHLLRRCIESVRFALFMYWYLDGCVQIGPESDQKDTLRIIVEIENVMTRSVPGMMSALHPADIKPAEDARAPSKLGRVPSSEEDSKVGPTLRRALMAQTSFRIGGGQERSLVHQGRKYATEHIDRADGKEDLPEHTKQFNNIRTPKDPMGAQDISTNEKERLDNIRASQDAVTSEGPWLEATVTRRPVHPREGSVSSLNRIGVDGEDAGTGSWSPSKTSCSTPDPVTLREYGETETEQESSIVDAYRGNLFHAQLDFTRSLISISEHALGMNRAQRMRFVVRELVRLNRLLESERRSVFLPTERVAHRVLRIHADEAIVFSTKEHAPYLVVVEVQDFESAETGERERRKTFARTIGDWLHRAGEHRSRATQPGQRPSSVWYGSPQELDTSQPSERSWMPSLADTRGTATGSLNPVSSNPEDRTAPPTTAPAATETRTPRIRLGIHERVSRHRRSAGSSETDYAVTFPGPNRVEAPFPFATLPRIDSIGAGVASKGASASLEDDNITGDEPQLKTPFLDTGSAFTETTEPLSERKRNPPTEEHHAVLESSEKKPSTSSGSTSVSAVPARDRWSRLFGEPWAEKLQRIRQQSPFGMLPGWRLTSVIVKSRDQLRQEMFATMLIEEFARVFDAVRLPVWLCPYRIVATGADSGFVQVIPDAYSIDQIKKAFHGNITLAGYFHERFGPPGSSTHRVAVRNFVMSMAAYSVVTYLLNIKDRHNGNLLIDAEGHIIHIDFGFLFTNSPGGNIDFEKSPFKLNWELADVMGGPDSNAFRLFRRLCGQAYAEACVHRNKIMLMVEFMMMGNESLPCFRGGADLTLEQLRERFMPRQTRLKRIAHMNALVDRSTNHWTTRFYDRYQRCCTGIY